ncbi:MAG: hypothetical protein QXK06_05000 [Candidatus Diapherotrites archaeon]
MDCISEKIGAPLNSENSALILLTNSEESLKLDLYDDGFLTSAGGLCIGGANNIVSTNFPSVVVHELGHAFFYFCDQYSSREYKQLDSVRKAAGVPAKQGVLPGCQNKYPGFVGSTTVATALPSRFYFDPDTRQLGSKPVGRECPVQYEKCDYEKGLLTTCCPNLPDNISDCSGRIIETEGQTGLSIMGVGGLEDLIPYDFDCFEKEAIKKLAAIK